jgi:hypothetical protein
MWRCLKKLQDAMGKEDPLEALKIGTPSYYMCCEAEVSKVKDKTKLLGKGIVER